MEHIDIATDTFSWWWVGGRRVVHITVGEMTLCNRDTADMCHSSTNAMPACGVCSRALIAREK